MSYQIQANTKNKSEGVFAKRPIKATSDNSLEKAKPDSFSKTDFSYLFLYL
jgi:hypothetical protein